MNLGFHFGWFLFYFHFITSTISLTWNDLKIKSRHIITHHHIACIISVQQVFLPFIFVGRGYFIVSTMVFHCWIFCFLFELLLLMGSLKRAPALSIDAMGMSYAQKRITIWDAMTIPFEEECWTCEKFSFQWTYYAIPSISSSIRN